MHTTQRYLRKAVALITCTIALLIGNSVQAVAIETAESTVNGVQIADQASADTRAWAAAHPRILAGGRDICGGPYDYIISVDTSLPNGPGSHGSMAAYAGGGYLCVIFYNETPGGANYMYFRACPGRYSSPACGLDSGYYSQYAGPLYISTDDNGCWVASYLMKNQAETKYLIQQKVNYGPC